MLLLALLNATYVSTLTGGLWSDASSWQAGVVPPCYNASSVLVQGPIKYTQDDCEVIDLQVEAAELQVEGDSLSVLQEVLLSSSASVLLSPSSSIHFSDLAITQTASIIGSESSSTLPLLRGGSAEVPNKCTLKMRDVDVWVDVFTVRGELQLSGDVAWQGTLRPMPSGDVLVTGTLSFATGTLSVIGDRFKGGGELKLQGEGSQVVVGVGGVFKDFRFMGDVAALHSSLVLKASVGIVGGVRFQKLLIESDYDGNVLTTSKNAFLAFDGGCTLDLNDKATLLAEQAIVFINTQLAVTGGTMQIRSSNVTVAAKCEVLVEEGATLFLDHNLEYVIDPTSVFAISGVLVIHHEGVLSFPPSFTLGGPSARLVLGPGIPTMSMGPAVLYSPPPGQPFIAAASAFLSVKQLTMLGGVISARDTSVFSLRLVGNANSIESDVEILDSMELDKIKQGATLIINGSLSLKGGLFFGGTPLQTAVHVEKECILGPHSQLTIETAPEDTSKEYLLIACGNVVGFFRERFTPINWGIVETSRGLELHYEPGSTPSQTTLPVEPTQKPGLTREQTLIIAVCVALGLLALALIMFIAVCCKLRRMRERGRYLPFDQAFNSEDEDPQSMDNQSFSPHLLDTSDSDILFE